MDRKTICLAIPYPLDILALSDKLSESESLRKERYGCFIHR